MGDTTTKISNLINPDVMADIIREKISTGIKFAPLAQIDTTLVGRPGDTVTLPKYAYIGDAADVTEGGSIPVSLLTATSVQAQVKKAGKGIELTDEAVLYGYGDPVGESAAQLAASIAQKVDADCAQALSGIDTDMTHDVGTTEILSSAVIADALTKFGEDLDDGPKVLFISAAQLAQLRHDADYLRPSDMTQQAIMGGTVGECWGCQLVVSGRIKPEGGKYTNYIVKPGALAIFLKRDVQVEADRNIVTKTTTITADEYYAAYLRDESKAIKLVVRESSSSTTQGG